MARNNIKGVKNEHTWKFYTILSSVIGVLIIALIIGLIISPAFTTIIFNFGTPLIAFVVYRKKVIPSLI